MLDCKTIKVGNKIIEYVCEGKGAPYVFFHGFGYPPELAYEENITVLAKEFEVIAPKTGGLNYIENPPESIEDCVELNFDFFNALGLDRFHLLGHSLGGAVGSLFASKSGMVSDLVLVNPVLPSNYLLGVLEQMLRGLRLNLKEYFGSSEDTLEINEKKKEHTLRIAGPYLKSMMQNPRASYKIISDIACFRYDGVDFNAPSLLLFGEDDDFFELTESTIKMLKERMPKIEMITFPEKNHDFMIFYPDLLLENIQRWHDENECE